MWTKIAVLACVAATGLGQGCEWDPEAKRVAREKEQRFRNAHPNSKIDPKVFEAAAAELPKNFNWCSLPDGRSLCTPSWNQHIPVYCGSCWLHGTLTHLQDRLYIQQGGKYPPVMLARQSILNCGPFYNMSNGCGGGSSLDVYHFMEMFGLPDEGCQVYEAKDNKKYGPHAKACPADGYCINCMNHGSPPRKECWPIHRPIKYSVSDYGPVPQGSAAMMVEIFNNGPIACGMVSYDDFNFNYRGGVWKKLPNDTDIDHIVEIVGWGESEADGPYWIVRNSWGTYWGEMGFFRAPRGNNALQLEVACYYATPSWEDEKLVRGGKLVGTMYGLVPTEEGPEGAKSLADPFKQVWE